MFSSSRPIEAVQIQPGGAEAHSGFCTVERQVDEKTYVLGFGHDQITVETPPNALSVGERVYVIASAGTLEIRQVQEPAGGKNESIAADLFLPQNKGSAADIRSSPSGETQEDRLFVAPRSLPEGLFTFADNDDARSFLGVTGVSSESNDDPSRESGGILVRTYTTVGDRTPARYLSQEGIPREIASWRANFGSRMFQSLPAEVFQRLLRSCGEVNLSQLYAMDNSLSDSRLPLVPAGMREAQTSSVTQWLQTAMESGAAPASLAALSPAPAPMVVGMLENLAATLGGSVPELGADEPEANFPNAGALADLADKGNFLRTIFGRIGLNFEAALLTDDGAARESLKGRLLQIADRLERGLLPSPGAPGSDSDLSSPARDAIPSVEENILRQIDSVLTRIESLQLLARPVSTDQGVQQIISLPLKIGDEWTEMHLRVITRRGVAKASTAAHYAVFLNLAPSRLGALAARLDYSPGKSLLLSMSFEKSETHAWFSDRKEQLQQSLAVGGLPLPSITLIPAKKENIEADGCGVGHPASTLVDVKA
jgi:hypothetical protein